MGKKLDYIVGLKFGRLVVNYKCDYTRKKLSVFHCTCDCGKECEICGTYLINGHTKSCGCLKHDITVQRLSKSNKYTNCGDYYIGYTLKGEQFFFDVDDYDKVKNYCWYITRNGYVSAKAKDGTSKHIFLHQLVLDKYVDHIGGKNTRNDNRKSNLRVKGKLYSFETYNNMNKGLQKNNKSGYPGVFWYKRDQIWEVYINVNKKRIYLGRYNDFDKAVSVRKAAEDKYFGEFSYNNSLKLANNNSIKEVV